MKTENKIRVLVVDDSPLIRSWLIKIINNSRDMKVVETASDGIYLLEKAKAYKPDVITLDISMPKMDGLTALKRLMVSQPSRVLIISSLTTNDADATMTALRLGAIDFITKPVNLTDSELDLLQKHVLQKIRAVSAVNINHIRYRAELQRKASPALPDLPSEKMDIDKIVLFGASTGGPIALEDILMRLPADFPYPIIISQHLPIMFSSSFAENLNYISRLQVKEISNMEKIKKGFVYIIPGGHNLHIRRRGNSLYGILIKGKNNYTELYPSVDELFISASEAVGKDIIAFLLTGLGNDGTEGVKKIQQSGGITIAQDSESSMAYSMPYNAIKTGAIKYIMSLGRIPDFLVNLAFKYNN